MVQKLLLAGLMTLAVNANAQSTSDAAYFTISKAQVRELSKDEAENAVAVSQSMKSLTFANTVEVPSLANVVGSVAGSNSGLGGLAAVGAEVDEANIVLDKIINLGKKVWDLVQEGKPVVNIKTDVATALPQGVRGVADLQNWQVPKYKVYDISYKNAYGITVVDLQYRVLFLSGGSVNGKGQYVGYASVEPLNVDVLWGFKLNVEASVPTVYFTGTKDNPVAALYLQIKWSVDPILGLQHQEQTQTYMVSGDGSFRTLQ